MLKCSSRLRVPRVAFAAGLCCGLVGLSGVSQAQSSNTATPYRLNPDSNYQRGCFAPCECPVMIAEPVKGTFLLTPAGFDPLYAYYLVTDVNWHVPLDNADTLVTGSGKYKIGGEFALQQQLSLDLQMNGQLAHFDSGLVAVSATFPDIKVDISTNHQYCFDTVFHVSASPAVGPPLSIGLTSTNTVVLNWPVSAAAFDLQECSDLAAANWTTVTNSPTVVGQQNQVVLPLSSRNRCFRLQSR